MNSDKGSIHLVMPMGGSGSRFSEWGFELPKPLIELHDKPFFYWATESIRKFIPLRSLTFVILKEHVKNFNIDIRIREFYDDANIYILDDVLDGAVLTCLEGVKLINDEAPVLFNDCDHLFTCKSFNDFCNNNDFSRLDGGLLTFTSSDPKFSFLELDKDSNVLRTVEKQAVSNIAICGAYYFRNRAIFIEAAEKYLVNCTYKEFFMSGVYNVMAKENQIIKSFAVDMHLPFGTPDEYKVAQKSNAFEVLK